MFPEVHHVVGGDGGGRLGEEQQGRLRAHLATAWLRLPGRGEEWPSTEDSAKHCYTRGEDLGYTFRALETVVVAVQAKEGAGALLGPGDRPVCLRETWFYGEQGGPGEALLRVEATRRTCGAVLNTGRLQQVEAAVQAVVVVGRRSEQEARDEEDRRRQAELEAAMGIKDSCGFHSLSAEDEAALRAKEGRADREERRRQEAGNALYKAGKVEEALVKYTEGLKLCLLAGEQHRAVLYGNRAQIKRSLGLTEHAVANCTKALQLNPKYLKVILRQGQILSESGRLGKDQDQDHLSHPSFPQTRL